VALVEVLHDRERLGEGEAVLEHGHPPRRVELREPRRTVGEVDLDRLVGQALLPEDEPDAGAEGAGGGVVELHGSTPIISAICA
jgi:hypothetical protein